VSEQFRNVYLTLQATALSYFIMSQWVSGNDPSLTDAFLSLVLGLCMRAC